MTVARFILLVVHVLVGAVWLGAMAYSLAVAQRRVRQYFGDAAKAEDLAVMMAAGARWKVIGMIALLALTGIGLVLVEGGDHSTGWQLAIGLKVALLIVATAVFCWVSWRLWPARLFALPDEIPRWQRRFEVVGGALICLVGAEFVLGIAAHVFG